MVVPIAGVDFDREGTFAFGTNRHVAIYGDRLTERFEIAGGRRHLAAVRSGITKTDHAATFAVFHV